MKELLAGEEQGNPTADEARFELTGKICGWCRSALLYGVLIVVSERFLQRDFEPWLAKYGIILIIVLVVLYAASIVVDIVMEKKHYGNCRETAVHATTPLVYLRDDFFRPYVEFFKSLICIFTFPKHTGGEVGISFVKFIAYGVLVAAFVISGLRLYSVIILFGF